MKRLLKIAFLLGLCGALADCSRCNFPTFGPSACHDEAPKTLFVPAD